MIFVKIYKIFIKYQGVKYSRQPINIYLSTDYISAILYTAFGEAKVEDKSTSLRSS